MIPYEGIILTKEQSGHSNIFFIYAYLNILAQSQILGNSLYFLCQFPSWEKSERIERKFKTQNPNPRVLDGFSYRSWWYLSLVPYSEGKENFLSYSPIWWEFAALWGMGFVRKTISNFLWWNGRIMLPYRVGSWKHFFHTIGEFLITRSIPLTCCSCDSHILFENSQNWKWSHWK